MKKNTVSVIILIIISILIFIIWNIKKEDRQKNIDINLISQENDINTTLDENNKPKINLNEIKSQNLPVILDFGSEGCPPCRAMKSDLMKIKKDYEGRVVVNYYDVWETPSYGEGFDIQLIPTQVFYDKFGNPFTSSKKEIYSLEYIYDENNNHIMTRHIGALTYEIMQDIIMEMESNE